MSGWPRVIEDADGDTVRVSPWLNYVSIITVVGDDRTTMMLTVDQCAALIAAITDAAKVVTGEKA